MPKPAEPKSPRQPDNVLSEITTGIEGDDPFKVSLGRELDSLKRVIYTLHDKDMMTLTAEICNLRQELSNIGTQRRQPQSEVSAAWTLPLPLTPTGTPRKIHAAIDEKEYLPFTPHLTHQLVDVAIDQKEYVPPTPRLSHQLFEPNLNLEEVTPEATSPKAVEPKYKTRLSESTPLSSQHEYVARTCQLWSRTSSDHHPGNLEHHALPFWGSFQHMVHHPFFDLVSSAIILANTIVMAVDLQYKGYNAGFDMSYPGFTQSATEKYPDARNLLSMSSVCFTVVFCMELFVRIAAAGRTFVVSGWIWFDIIIVLLGLMELCGVGFGINPAVARALRLLRLLRLIKVFQVLARQEFDSLFLLIKAIRASTSALLWSFLFLFTVQVVTGIFLCQIVQDYFDNDSHDQTKKQAVFLYFGTFTRTMLAMFEITFANWAPVCRILVEEVNDWFSGFFMVYRCMFCFAALRVVSAVFIAETNRVLEHDDDLNNLKKERERRVLHKKLRKLFQQLDIDGNGTFDWQELDTFITSKEVHSAASAVGFDKFDLIKIFWLLDNGSGAVSVNEFLSKTGRLKGESKAIDMQTLLKLTHRIDKAVQSFSARGNASEALQNLGPG